MAGITVDPKLIEEAKHLFETNAKRGDIGPGKVKFTVTQKDTVAFYTANGIPSDVQTKIAEVEAALYTGAIQFIDDQMPAIVDQAKANGTPVEDIRVSVRTATPASACRVTVDGVSVSVNPKNREETTTVYGRCGIKVVPKKYIPEDVLLSHFSAMEALLKQ